MKINDRLTQIMLLGVIGLESQAMAVQSAADAPEASDKIRPTLPTTADTSQTDTTKSLQAGLQTGDIEQFHGSQQSYIKTIRALEDMHGVYDMRLTRELTGLGIARQKQGEHKQAVDAFKRAVHVSRVNEGLYNLGQVTLLNYLVESYTETRDWLNASNIQYYLYQLKKRNFGENDQRLIEPLEKIVKWHIKAYLRSEGQTPVKHLLKARALNLRAINIIEFNFGSHDKRLADALYRQALTSYQLAVFQYENTEPGSGLAGMNNHRPGTDIAFSDSDYDRMVYALNPYSDGKKALIRRVDIFEKNPDLPLEEKAEALVHLGDWYFLFNKRESAIKTYQRAQQAYLANEVTKADVERVFGKPHALIFSLGLRDEEEQKEEEADKEGYVEAMFNITAGGWARNVKIIESNPPEVMDAKVQRSIKAIRYRPRFVDGRPVLTENVTYRHQFVFDGEAE